MKKYLISILILVIGIAIGFYIPKPPIIEKEIVVKEVEIKCPKFQQLEEVMDAIKKGKYSTEKDNYYTCYQFSQDFEKLWNEMGYDGIMIFGSSPASRIKNSVGHTWYAVYVEPMTGEFVKVNQYIPEDRDYYINQK